MTKFNDGDIIRYTPYAGYLGYGSDTRWLVLNGGTSIVKEADPGYFGYDLKSNENDFTLIEAAPSITKQESIGVKVNEWVEINDSTQKAVLEKYADVLGIEFSEKQFFRVKGSN